MAKRQWSQLMTQEESKQQQQQYRCQHPLLSMVYGLNKTYSKKICFGLENLEHGSQEYIPMVRVCGEDLTGIPLSLLSWSDFKNNFSTIDKFFGPQGDELMEQRIDCLGFSLRFMVSYSDKAFEIIEHNNNNNNNNNNTTSCKRYQRSLIFKKNTFDCLKSISKCIDYRIQYLEKIIKVLPLILSELCNIAQSKLDAQQESQYTYYSSHDILSVMDLSTIESTVTNLKKKIVSETDNNNITEEDIYITLYELVYLHMFTVVSTINKK